MADSNDPAAVRTVVVMAEDLVAALEANARRGTDETVLRVTPPFSGRMRARLHVEGESTGTEPASVTLRPRSLVADDCPPPPEPDGVEDALRADPDETYTVDRHRERYRTALREWRRGVPDHAVDEVTIPGTDRDVTLSVLGTVPRE